MRIRTFLSPTPEVGRRHPADRRDLPSSAARLPLRLNPRRWVATALLLAASSWPAVLRAQQTPSDSVGKPGPHTTPTRHALYLAIADGPALLLSHFPASYLARASGRDVSAPAALGTANVASLSLGFPLSSKVFIEAEVAGLADHLDARSPERVVEVPVDVLILGGRALWWPKGDLFVGLGGGTIRFDPGDGGLGALAGADPTLGRPDTEFQGNVAIGLWPRFAGGLVRVELRDYVSWFSPAGVPSRDHGLRNDLTLVSAVTVGLF